MSGRLPASFRERDFSRGKFSRLQLFRYVQASELACLPDRSYRCRFPRRAAEAFTSEQNVRRCLRTHRICSPPDYRQLAARGLSPREIHSIVDCSIDPSPFRNKDLDPKAEEFIVGWAKDLPREATLALVVDLDREAGLPDEAAVLRDAIHEFFSQRAQTYRRRLRELLRLGRTSLVIGLVALV